MKVAIKGSKFCQDCGAPAKYSDPYSQCETCWEEWWNNNEADVWEEEPKQNRRMKREKDE